MQFSTEGHAMALSPRLVRFSLAGFAFGCLALSYGLGNSGVRPPGADSPTVDDSTMRRIASADEMIRQQQGCFVPNLGQWEHRARFVHRSGPMTLFLLDRGWIVNLVEHAGESRSGSPDASPEDQRVEQKFHGVALHMTFAGAAPRPKIVGEKKLPGHHNYFLGDDETQWMTGVPRYGSVRYEGLYPGIDLRLRAASGVPEYDLMLQPGADLSRVIVCVEGGEGLSIARDGSLIIETALGPVTQSVPRTWETISDGSNREVVCKFTLLGADRFGFEVPSWRGDTSLTVDPSLIWSTFLGGSSYDEVNGISVDDSGVVTVTGGTGSAKFPTTTGAYDTINNGGDVFVSQLDPSRSTSTQLIYSTFLGGGKSDYAFALSLDSTGTVTVAGFTQSADFPTTGGAYDSTHNGGYDVFVSRLIPAPLGGAALRYSTYLGGSASDANFKIALFVEPSGVVTVAGNTVSLDFPTTLGAYDSTHNGVLYRNGRYSDAFVSRLDPRKSGAAQLVFSTYLGGSGYDYAFALSVDSKSIVTVAGVSFWPNFPKSVMFPTTSGAYNTYHNGGEDVFISRLDPSKKGKAQLVYSTLLGGGSQDRPRAMSVDSSGIVTVAGAAGSNFPTTRGAYDVTFNGYFDVFVSRLDPSRAGAAQLLYSTLLGGASHESATDLSVDSSGVITLAGHTWSARFPTTGTALDTTYNGGVYPQRGDAFVSRLDPRCTGAAQLVYSTFFGGSKADGDIGVALVVDPSGVVTVAGRTQSLDFPTTLGAYDTTYNGGKYWNGRLPDSFISRISMGVPFYADRYALSLNRAGTQTLNLDAGKQLAGKSFAIFGSVTGTAPGVTLTGIHIPLNFDAYTLHTIASAVPPIFIGFRGILNGQGQARASFHVPSGLPTLPGFTLYHAYLVFDNSGRIFMASNAVPILLR